MKTFSKKPAESERHHEVHCAVCGSDDAVKHWQCDDFGFVKCRECGHVYQNPQPDADSLLNRYDEEYSDYEVENSVTFLTLMLKGLDDVGFFKRMEADGIDRSLLDVGCATGALLEYAARRGYRVQGVEVCEPAAEYGREHRGVPISVGTLESARLDNSTNGGRFGAFHASHVIEHVPDPRAFLRSAYQRLVDGGYLVIVTPNTAGLQARLFGAQWRSAIADHVNLFSKRNLLRLIRECGFRPVATQTWGGLGIGTAPGWLKRPVDRCAKACGFGDVVLVMARRRKAGA